MPRQLIDLVENLPKSRVILIGDLMLDRYLYGNAERVSPEAPVPVLHFQEEEFRLGGAGNVAANLAVLGAVVRVVGCIGNDPAGEQMMAKLSAAGVDTSLVQRLADRPTISKMRLVGFSQHKNPQQLMRLDYEDPAPISTGLCDEISARLKDEIANCDVVCVEDYNKGLLTPGLMQSLIAAARERKIPVIVDPANIADYSKYRGATALKMNRPEAERATQKTVRGDDDYAPAAQWLLDNLDLEAVIITLDRHGSYLATRDGQHRLLSTRERQVSDGTGAGDMVHAMITMARAAGASWSEAVALANIAGGLEVERFGVVPITPQEIIHELLSESHEGAGKLRTRDELAIELARHRNAGKKIVFTNGCFDLVHLGHIKYFQFAKEQGDLLVVGVNTDASIRRLKGSKRPIINEHDRVEVLAELESIDYLVKFDEDTPLELIQAITPDVLVKGADYAKEDVIGWDIVEAAGGRVALAPLVDGRSTSAVIQRILEAYR